MINVIFATPGRTDSYPSRVMSIARLPAKDSNSKPKMAKLDVQWVLGFLNEDKIGTTQGSAVEDVKRVLVDQGSAVEIMYPDLYMGLNLKPEDLTACDSPLVSFERKTVTLKVRLDYPYRPVWKWWR